MEENLKQFDTEIIKIVLFGPESTGKTNLYKQLKQEFNNIFVSKYLQIEWLESQEKFTENDLFFLIDVNFSMQNENLVDKPNHAESSLSVFEKALIDYNKPFIKLFGNENACFEKAKKIIKDFKKAKKIGFNSFDFIEIYSRNSNIDTIDFQFSILKNGIPKINLNRPAVFNDGIIKINEDEAVYYSNFFDEKKDALKLKKFVPASGAASRMFKFLNEFLIEFKLGEESINAYINRKKDKSLPVFLVAKEKFPFYKQIKDTVKQVVPDYSKLDKDGKDYWFIKIMLSPKYYDFANKPKGVLPFHQYLDSVSTAIEEHLKECTYYAVSNGVSHLHFTVSEEHHKSFESIVSSVKPLIENAANQKINIKYSYQNKSTDVVAVDSDGNPFRDEDNKILFRPGGHGALIENLNMLCADIVFIKNIDNVIQNNIKIISLYKKALAGILIQYQNQIFSYLKILNNEISNETLLEISNFIESKLNISIKDDFIKFTKESKIEHLKILLNRPIRVCGMVKNEGEPGGGPFWVTDKKGKTFLQIIESSQVDMKDENQVKIFESATHFNPVDLVCGIKDYNGQKFDLTHFIDANSGFVVEKNKNGKPYKAFELPGLWNGAMAKWLTIFVEVPLITFNPVKTVNDLLKPAHQPLES